MYHIPLNLTTRRRVEFIWICALPWNLHWGHACNDEIQSHLLHTHSYLAKPRSGDEQLGHHKLVSDEDISLDAGETLIHSIRVTTNHTFSVLRVIPAHRLDRIEHSQTRHSAVLERCRLRICPSLMPLLNSRLAAPLPDIWFIALAPYPSVNSRRVTPSRSLPMPETTRDKLAARPAAGNDSDTISTPDTLSSVVHTSPKFPTFYPISELRLPDFRRYSR